MRAGPIRTAHTLNSAQQAAFDAIQEAIRGRQFQTFLLHGVTGSGKTEVYLNGIDAALAQDRSALLLVPEIATAPTSALKYRCTDTVLTTASRMMNRLGARYVTTPSELAPPKSPCAALTYRLSA